MEEELIEGLRKYIAEQTQSAALPMRNLVLRAKYSYFDDQTGESGESVKDLKEFIDKELKEKGESFCEAVDRFLEEKGLTPSKVQEAGGLCRQDYARVANRLHPVKPKKTTVWKFVIGLKLDLREAAYLLGTVGYGTEKNILDLTFSYAVLHGVSTLDGVNELLRAMGEREVPNKHYTASTLL